MLPDPKRLPKEIWKSRILPIMALKMGLQDENYERVISAEEREVERANNINLQTPIISKEDFKQIEQYIESNSPDTVLYDYKRIDRSKPLRQFVRMDFPLDKDRPSLMTALKYDSSNHNWWIGNFHNEAIQWRWNQGIVKTINVSSPIVAFNFKKNKVFFTEIGDLLPSELSKGSLASAEEKTELEIMGGLHRPVYTELADLDGDGIDEIVTCNFGKNIGSLSLYRKDSRSSSYLEKKLLPVPGAIKVFIKDMDGDGKKDIIALFAQGDESVYIFFNQGDCNFLAKRIIRFPPESGTSDFLMTDYDNDGLTDIITAHGDNADYSIVLKNFHGLRFHRNMGDGSYDENIFLPIYGVTKVIAEDFDRDGDTDFATSSFYPDYGNLLKESFVYIENVDHRKKIFQIFVHETDLPLRSLVLEKGDIDADGDIDIVLGNFAFSPVSAPAQLERKWRSANYGLNVFLNQTSSKKGFSE